jgi:hypothetical protein
VRFIDFQWFVDLTEHSVGPAMQTCRDLDFRIAIDRTDVQHALPWHAICDGLPWSRLPMRDGETDL